MPTITVPAPVPYYDPDHVLHIRWNWNRRPLLTWWELSADQRKDVSYAEPESPDSELNWHQRFVIFRGDVYDLNDGFLPLNDPKMPLCKAGWELAMSDSVWSGILVRGQWDEFGQYIADEEGVVVGRYWE